MLYLRPRLCFIFSRHHDTFTILANFTDAGRARDWFATTLSWRFTPSLRHDDLAPHALSSPSEYIRAYVDWRQSILSTSRRLTRYDF